MDTNTLKRIDSFMDQQLNALKMLLDLVDTCEEKKLTNAVDDTELQQLKDATADMMLACTTSKKLAEALKPVLEAEEKAKTKKQAKPKKVEPTKVEKEPAELPAKEEPVPDPSDEDDMDFLD